MKPTEWPSWGGQLATRGLPLDLVVAVAFVLLADVLVSFVAVGPGLRLALGLPFLFFLPGYVLLAALFPAKPSARLRVDPRSVARGDAGVPLATRLALSFGLSVALLPVLAVLLALTPVGFGVASIIGLLTVLVVVGAAVGTVRRLRLPLGDRFRVPARRWIADLLEYVTGPGRPIDVAIRLLLVVSVLVAASGFAYALFVPPDRGSHEDVMLLTRAPDGEYVSSGYPTEFVRGDGEELVVGVANHGEEPTRYTIVLEVQRVRGRASSFRVVERSELARFGTTVDGGETWYRPHDVAPDLVGEDLRLVYYLYRGDAPATPSRETAETHLHLWIDVSIGG